MSLESDKARIEKISDLLYHAARKQNILGHVTWDPEIGRRFLEKNASELPKVEYAPFDPEPTYELIRDARALLKGGSTDIDLYFTRQANTIENAARLLASCGTKQFFEASSELWGKPKDVQPDGHSTSLELASHFLRILGSLEKMDLGAPADSCTLASFVAEKIGDSVKKMFGDLAPEIQIVDSLSANAIAGRNRIRIRRTACFTDKDIAQLIHHEAHIHVATSLNGNEQPLKILAASHPGTTKTQEGLAVFSELITGSMDLDRMTRLSNRVIAVQMAIDGADFIEVYRYFHDQVGHSEQAFENTARVFRGGVVTGGSPITKDVVYLEGLIRVHNFLRAIVSTGRADCLRMLFCGKLDIDDIPILWEFEKLGLCKPPRFLPPWASDLRFLFSYLAYSSFLNGMDLEPIKLHYNDLLRNLPVKAA